MSLGQVSLLFLVQMGFGSTLTFVLNDRRALGPKYFKVGGWILVALYGLALTLVAAPALAADASSEDRLLATSVLAAALSLLAFASLSGWEAPRAESALLWAGLACGALAVWAAAVRGLDGTPTAGGAGFSPLERALVVAGAFGSALALGFTTFAMLLGHWYLLAPGLALRHLATLVRPLPWIYGAKTVLSAAALALLWERFLGPGTEGVAELLSRRPERILDVFTAWTRIPVGLLLPAVLAFLVRATVRLEKTQPATGILYAMCVTVYLGDLMGKLVEGGTGVPL